MNESLDLTPCEGCVYVVVDETEERTDIIDVFESPARAHDLIQRLYGPVARPDAYWSLSELGSPFRTWVFHLWGNEEDKEDHVRIEEWKVRKDNKE